MKSNWRLIIVLGILIFMLTGCEEYNLVIREELRGKWETKSISTDQGGYVSNWVVSDLPDETNGIYTQGWLIEENAVTLYRNGDIVSKHTSAYSDIYEMIELDDNSRIYVRLDGNTLTVQYHDDVFFEIWDGETHRDTCKRVSKFSWE